PRAGAATVVVGPKPPPVVIQLGPDLAATSSLKYTGSGYPYAAITVTNRGNAPAGAFVVDVRYGTLVLARFSSAGLAAGGSQSFRYSLDCEAEYHAEVDPFNQVRETNETNNRTPA